MIIIWAFLVITDWWVLHTDAPGGIPFALMRHCIAGHVEI
jgi:hypothetical protein